MIPLFASLDLKDAGAVLDTLAGAAAANRTATCRHGSIDRIAPPGRLIATGDLHDNPLHLARLAQAAGLGDPGKPPSAHLTLHEVLHPDTLINGMDFSYRALTRVAALKAAHPEHVHTLLANHELSQVLGAGIVKGGVRVVDAFNEGVGYVFGSRAAEVLVAVAEFIRSMPLALVSRPLHSEPSTGVEGGPSRAIDNVPEPPSTPVEGSVLCAHSLPAPELMDRFDPGILERDLAEDDYAPRRGSAHLMVWGRGHTPEQLRALALRWSVDLFILGHEKADSGAMSLGPNAVVLNSDHERGVYLPIDLSSPPPGPAAVLVAVRPLAAEMRGD